MVFHSQYKPHLPSDKKYLAQVAKTLKGRKPIEEIHFEYFTHILHLLGFPEDPYSFISLDDINPEPLQKLVAKSFEAIQNRRLTGELKELLLQLWDYLSEEDTLKKADLIFVFGGPGDHRAHEAVKVWKGGFGDNILFTGQQASYMIELTFSEAEHYAQIAKKEGVHEINLILETSARNTPENVANSLLLLHEKKYFPEKIILITNYIPVNTVSVDKIRKQNPDFVFPQTVLYWSKLKISRASSCS